MPPAAPGDDPGVEEEDSLVTRPGGWQGRPPRVHSGQLSELTRKQATHGTTSDRILTELAVPGLFKILKPLFFLINSTEPPGMPEIFECFSDSPAKGVTGMPDGPKLAASCRSIPT